MTRLIDKKCVLESVKALPAEFDAETVQRCIEVLSNQPEVDAVPVRHGEWIDEGQYGDNFPHHAWRCSECGEHVIEIDTPWYKYCPFCGSRMDAEVKDNG